MIPPLKLGWASDIFVCPYSDFAMPDAPMALRLGSSLVGCLGDHGGGRFGRVVGFW